MPEILDPLRILAGLPPAEHELPLSECACPEGDEADGAEAEREAMEHSTRV